MSAAVKRLQLPHNPMKFNQHGQPLSADLQAALAGVCTQAEALCSATTVQRRVRALSANPAASILVTRLMLAHTDAARLEHAPLGLLEQKLANTPQQQQQQPASQSCTVSDFWLNYWFTVYERQQQADSSSQPSHSTFETLHFNNRSVTSLPLDPESQNFPRSPVADSIFSLVEPTPVEKPVVVATSVSALSLVGLAASELKREDAAAYLSGNKTFTGCRPAAHCYCGHQFGYFSGQLGDGATMYLGEVTNSLGEHWEIQFKGAGKTPYSRTADGRKVLRSSIREFLGSEAMHGLQIPTTRCGSLVTSDTKVVRDIFYTGDNILERASIITRIAPSFFRFGSFEIVRDTDPKSGRTGSSPGNVELLQHLVDYCITHYYPQHAELTQPEERYQAFFTSVVRRSARLVAKWDCVGWCHGVLNTDNMSILGLTIDYGPYGFMEAFDRNFVCNKSDNEGRYSYDNQRPMVKWNCLTLGETLKSLLPVSVSRDIVAKVYDDCYEEEFYGTMQQKLGLLRVKQPDNDVQLVKSLLDVMQASGADFTNTFRNLTWISLDGEDLAAEKEAFLEFMLGQTASRDSLVAARKPDVPLERIQMLRRMITENPLYAAQRGLTEEVLAPYEEAYVQFAELEKLTQQDKTAEDRKVWSQWIDRYADRVLLETKDAKAAGVDLKQANLVRETAMNSVNPLYVLRNHIAQDAIEKAETGDYSQVRRLLELLRSPFSKLDNMSDEEEARLTARDNSGAVNVS